MRSFGCPQYVLRLRLEDRVVGELTQLDRELHVDLLGFPARGSRTQSSSGHYSGHRALNVPVAFNGSPSYVVSHSKDPATRRFVSVVIRTVHPPSVELRSIDWLPTWTFSPRATASLSGLLSLLDAAGEDELLERVRLRARVQRHRHLRRRVELALRDPALTEFVVAPVRRTMFLTALVVYPCCPPPERSSGPRRPNLQVWRGGRVAGSALCGMARDA
jgi:hypothetical protein